MSQLNTIKQLQPLSYFKIKKTLSINKLSTVVFIKKIYKLNCNEITCRPCGNMLVTGTVSEGANAQTHPS